MILRNGVYDITNVRVISRDDISTAYLVNAHQTTGLAMPPEPQQIDPVLIGSKLIIEPDEIHDFSKVKIKLGFHRITSRLLNPFAFSCGLVFIVDVYRQGMDPVTVSLGGSIDRKHFHDWYQSITQTDIVKSENSFDCIFEGRTRQTEFQEGDIYQMLRDRIKQNWPAPPEVEKTR